MKQAILAFLKTKMPGVQAAYLDGVADRYSKIIQEEGQIETVLSDGVIDVLTFSAKHSQAEGDRRAQDAIRGYEEKYNLRNGEKAEREQPKNEPPKEGSEIPAWAQVLIDANKALTDKVAAFEAERQAKTKEQAAAEALRASQKLPDNLKQAWISRINPDNDLAEQIQALEAEYDSIYTSVVGNKSGKGLEVGGRVEGTISDDEAKSLIEKM
jgi:hypothetical protein